MSGNIVTPTHSRTMRNHCRMLAYLFTLLFVPLTICPQTTINVDQLEGAIGQSYTPTGVVHTDQEILDMGFKDACKALGVDSHLDHLHRAIIVPLCLGGKVLFKATSSPHGEDEFLAAYWREFVVDQYSSKHQECYWYFGTCDQEHTLIRNLVANRHLLKDGFLVLGAVEAWKVVE